MRIPGAFALRNRISTLPRLLVGASVLTGLLFAEGCHIDMWVQPKAKPFQQSDFFADGTSSRVPVAGTVSHKASSDQLRVENAFYTGIDPATKKLVDALPASIPLNKATLHRGQERFDIYCSPCHGRLGDGQGMIAQRGLALRKTPGNYHTPRLRKAPLGHFFDVITNGHGVMYPYASRVEPEDRWKIAAYIRVLQLSQNARAADVPDVAKGQLATAPPPGTEPPVPATPPGGGGAAGSTGERR